MPLIIRIIVKGFHNNIVVGAHAMNTLRQPLYAFDEHDKCSCLPTTFMRFLCYVLQASTYCVHTSLGIMLVIT